VESEKADALIIRLADFSNTSRVVTLFTREFGRISAIAKGGKRLKGPFESALDLLSTCRVVFLRKSSSALDILTEASLKQRFRPEPGNINSFYAGCYVAELLAGFTEDYDPHPRLYDSAQWALQQFSSTADVRLAVLKFELTALQETGQLPSLEECEGCGEPIVMQSSYTFRMSHTGVMCPRCGDREHSAVGSYHHVHAGTIAVMRNLVRFPDHSITRLTASPQQLREMRSALTTAVSTILGRRSSTLRYIPF